MQLALAPEGIDIAQSVRRHLRHHYSVALRPSKPQEAFDKTLNLFYEKGDAIRHSLRTGS
jgi:hypothetical protein